MHDLLDACLHTPKHRASSPWDTARGRPLGSPATSSLFLQLISDAGERPFHPGPSKNKSAGKVWYATPRLRSMAGIQVNLLEGQVTRASSTPARSAVSWCYGWLRYSLATPPDSYEGHLPLPCPDPEPVQSVRPSARRSDTTARS